MKPRIETAPTPFTPTPGLTIQGVPYTDDRWPLNPKAPHAPKGTMSFTSTPDGFKDALKAYAYLALTYRQPAALGHKELTPSTIRGHIKHLTEFAQWATQTGIRTIAEVTQDNIDEWAHEFITKYTGRGSTPHFALKPYAHYNPWLAQEHQLNVPTGHINDVTKHVYRQLPQDLAEARTKVIAPDTLAAVCTWVDRYIDLIAPSIINPASTPARINGQLWRTAPASPRELASETRNLTAACIVVIAYQTGMRPEELLNLETHCLTTTELPDGRIRHAITGREFPTFQHTPDHEHGGRQRPHPWAATPSAARAIQILRQLHPTGPWLLTSKNHPPKSGTINRRITRLVNTINNWCQENDQHDLTIPEDPNGGLALTRFRRTLAAHIAGQKDGIFALAAQYGHRNTATSRMYAARVTTGGTSDLNGPLNPHRQIDLITQALNN